MFTDSVSREVLSGNPQAIVMHSKNNVRTSITRLFVRTQNAEGGFSYQSIEGQAAIREFLERQGAGK